MKVLVFPVLLGVAVYTARVEPPRSLPQSTHWAGTFSNGLKGATVSFDVAPDGKTVSNLTFQGYWRCSGKLEQLTAGPRQTFTIQNGKARGVVVDPPQDGTAAWRYAFDGEIGKVAAQGTFRMNTSGLGCDTYQLQWTAAPTP